MSSGTNTIVITKNGAPLADYSEAEIALLKFTRHMCGQIVSVLYRVSDPLDPVSALMAVGTKNWDECGPAGKYDPDPYINKFYPTSKYPDGPCGPEFFDIVNISIPPAPTPVILNNTTFDINGEPVTVANQNGSDENVSDPFKWNDLKTDLS